MSYDGLLLDFDGVVVEVLEDEKRVPAFRAQFEQLLTGDGVTLDRQVIDALAHSVTPDRVESFSDQSGLPPEQLWRYRDDAFAELFQTVAGNGDKDPFDDVTALDGVDVPLGIASNNQRRIVESLVAEYGLGEYFSSIRAREPTLESLDRKKPEPVFLEEAIADLAVENPLYVGDKETDILAGQRIGIDTALIRRGHNADRAIGTDPTYEVRGLEEVVALLD